MNQFWCHQETVHFHLWAVRHSFDVDHMTWYNGPVIIILPRPSLWDPRSLKRCSFLVKTSQDVAERKQLTHETCTFTRAWFHSDNIVTKHRQQWQWSDYLYPCWQSWLRSFWPCSVDPIPTSVLWQHNLSHVWHLIGLSTASPVHLHLGFAWFVLSPIENLSQSQFIHLHSVWKACVYASGIRWMPVEFLLCTPGNWET